MEYLSFCRGGLCISRFESSARHEWRAAWLLGRSADPSLSKPSKGRSGVTINSMTIAMVAGLAMPLSFGTAVAGVSAPAPSNPEDEPLSSQSSAAPPWWSGLNSLDA